MQRCNDPKKHKKSSFFVKNEQFSTLKKSKKSKKSHFCPKCVLLDLINTEQVKVGQVRSFRRTTEGLKLTCLFRTPYFSIVKGKTVKNHPPMKCRRNFFCTGLTPNECRFHKLEYLGEPKTNMAMGALICHSLLKFRSM